MKEGSPASGGASGARGELRVLIVEDVEQDALLLVRELRKGGYEPTFRRVQTRAALEEALDEGSWDVVLSDHRMPFFDSSEALDVLKEKGSQTSFILVSGEIEAEAAVATMRAGARDYVSKDDLSRLSAVIARELAEAERAREHRRTAAALERSEALYRTVVEQAAENIFIVDAGSRRIVEANPSFYGSLGYTAEEIRRLTLYDVVASDRESVDRNIERVLRERRSRIGERQYRRKDGTLIDVEVKASAIPHDAGEALCVVAHDITRRKRVEEELRKSEAVLANAQRITHLGSWEWDLVSGETYWSEELYRICGLDAAGPPPGMDAFVDRVVHPEDRERVRGAGREALDLGKPYDLEHRILRPDGSERTVQCRAGVLTGASGGPERVFGTVQDVTEHRQTEERYRAVIEHSTEGIYLFDAQTRRILETNASFQEMLGYSADELVGMEIHDLIAHPREYVERNVRLTLEEGSRFVQERRYRRKEGGTVDTEVSVSVVATGGREIVCAIVRDVTERRRMEEELRRAEEKYRSIFENTADGIFQTSLDGRFLTLNPAMARIFGYGSPGEMVRAVPDVTALYVDSSRREDFIGRMRRSGVVSGFEVQVYRKGGEEIWVSVDARALYDAAGELAGFEGTLEDVTERKQIEEALLESHALLRSVVEGTTEAIFLKDARGRYLLANSAAARIMGRPVEDILGKTDAELFPPEVARTLMEVDRRVLDSGEPNSSEEDLPTAGVVRTYLSTKSPHRDYRGKIVGIIGVATDITERQRSERALAEVREAERSRIARDLHDVVLHHIVAALQTMQADQLEGRETGVVDFDREIEELRRAVQGLRDAIYDLRLERRQPFLKAVESVVELCREAEPEREIGLVVEEGFPAELPDAASVEIVRIIQEALANVRRHSGARRVRVTLSVREGALAVEVMDDGRGFVPDTVPGGIGLSAMRERALEVEGTLEVESEPGEGTLVRLVVPNRSLLRTGTRGRPGLPGPREWRR